MFREPTTAVADLDSRSSAHGTYFSRSPATLPFRKTFAIGGIALRLEGSSSEDVDGGLELAQFETHAMHSDIEVKIEWVKTLPVRNVEQAFESGATWRLFPVGNDLLFEIASPLLGPDPYKQLFVEKTFRHAELLLNTQALRYSEHVLPVEYPVCELLVTNYLAHHDLGIEVHGCGVIDRDNRGHLFLGHSGAGKSTTARLWETFHDTKILSDDRIILRQHDGELWMYGTPWHGEAAFAFPGKARLNHIFLLEHGTANSFSQLSAGRAVAEIFARSFPPFHSVHCLECTMDFLNCVVDLVPCYDFQFAPDRSAIESVLNHHD